MRYILVALTILCLVETAPAREQVDPLPDARQVRTISVRFDHPKLNVVEFKPEPAAWKVMRQTLLPATRDSNPSQWEWAGTVALALRDGRSVRVELYSTSKDPGAFAVEAKPGNRVYYRGGRTKDLLKALREVFESSADKQARPSGGRYPGATVP